MSGSTYTEEVLDLRELILILWRRKWLIVGVPLLVGGLILLVYSTLVPKRYQTTAIITITDRQIWTSVEITSMMQLAESGVLREQTYEALGVTASEGERLFTLSADTDGRGQLLLEVTALEADLAAEAANIWAGVITDKIIDLFGGTEDSLAELEEEVAQAEQIWVEAQSKLEEFRSESDLQIYPSQLAAAQFALEETLLEIERNRLLLSDVQSLSTQVQDLDPAYALTSGLELNLVNLQARAAAIDIVAPVQIQVDQPSLTLEDAASYLQVLQSALEIQNQRLIADVDSLENEILGTSLALEKEIYSEAQLIQDRDQAQLTYGMVLANLEEEKVLQDQDGSNIIISAEALPPLTPVSSNSLTAMSFAILSTALLTILGVLFQDWWVGTDIG